MAHMIVIPLTWLTKVDELALDELALHGRPPLFDASAAMMRSRAMFSSSRFSSWYAAALRPTSISKHLCCRDRRVRTQESNSCISARVCRSKLWRHRHQPSNVWPSTTSVSSMRICPRRIGAVSTFLLLARLRLPTLTSARPTVTSAEEQGRSRLRRCRRRRASLPRPRRHTRGNVC